MKIFRLLMFVVVTCILVGKLQSQEVKLEFLKQEIFEKHKVVYFCLNRSVTEVEFKEIYNDMYDDQSIIEIKLEAGSFVVAKVKNKVTPEYILGYLKKHDLDFKYEVIGKTVAETPSITPEHYPVKIESGNPHQDDKNFEEALSKWKIEYPEEWETYKNELSK